MSFLDAVGSNFEYIFADPSFLRMGYNFNQLPIHESIKKAIIDCIQFDLN